MNYLMAHPLMNTSPGFRRKGNMGDWWEIDNWCGSCQDVVEFIDNSVQGLGNAIGEAIGAIVEIIADVVKLVLQTVAAALGIISWNEVLNTLGEIARDVGHLLVVTNPARIAYDVLMKSDLTRHSFKELDKFTGGMISTAVNLSDVVARGMRGDPISKEELLREALLLLQIAAVIFAGPLGWAVVGAMVGGMVGNEVCKHQTDAQDACKAAFQIAGAVAGGYVGAEGLLPTWESPLEHFLTPASTVSQAGAAGTAIAEGGFTAYLTTAGESVARQRITDEATKIAIEACKRGHWVGERECAILGHIVQNYANSPEDQEWTEFLAEEAARLGVALVLEQAFPKNSKENLAITDYIISTPNLPPQAESIEQVVLPPPARKNMGGFLLMAAAAAGVLFMGGAM